MHLSLYWFIVAFGFAAMPPVTWVGIGIVNAVFIANFLLQMKK